MQTFAQQEKDFSASKHRKLGQRYEMLGDKYSAIYHYSKSLEKDSSGKYYKIKLAELYADVRNYSASARYFEELFREYSKIPLHVIFDYGRVLKSCGNYEKAIEFFKLYRKKAAKSKKVAEYRKQAKTEIEGCELALNGSLIDTTKQVVIEKMNETVNYLHSDYSPLPINDTVLYYASVRTNNPVYYNSPTESFTEVSQFYKAIRKNNNWEGGILIPDSFNIKNQWCGNAVICPHKNRLYFTVCELNAEGKNICSIWMSELIAGKWSAPEKLSKLINKPGSTSTQPAIGIDPRQNREVLYFISDRKGGKGGLDIWYSILDHKTSEFLEPKNAGSKINTFMNEVSPFIDEDNGKLYFSSESHSGIGGFDIFSTSGSLRKWEEPKNIGIPFNSPADDLYYKLVPEKTNAGFLVSNREGGTTMYNTTCCDDIYSFSFKEYVHIRISGRVITFKNDKKDQYIEDFLDNPSVKIPEGGKLVDSALLTLILVSGKDEIVIKSVITSTNGIYNFKLESGKEYKINVAKDSFFSTSYSLSTVKIFKSDTIFHDFLLKKIPDKPIIIRNIYYAFNRYNLSDTAKAIIDTTIYAIMTENPLIIAEISSHTDNKGTDNYNLSLSQKRAQSVVNYLIYKGIQQERLQAKGYGESSPIAPNQNTDGSDNPEGRQKNRRTEFKVIGILPEYQRVIYEE